MSKSILLVIFSVIVVSFVNGRRMRGRIWSDCGSNPNGPFRVRFFNVTPYPVEIPGSVTVSLSAETRREVEDVNLRLSIRRHLFSSYYLPIPCISGQGSCLYRNVCGILHPKDPAAEYEPVRKIKAMFQAAGRPLDCPFKPGTVNIINYTDVLPEVPSFVSYVARGTYEIRARFEEPGTGYELGCFRLRVEVIEKEPEPVEEDCWFWCD